MLTKQMKKDLANPADVIEIVTSNSAQIKAIRAGSDYKIATAFVGPCRIPEIIEPKSWYFNSQDLRETAAVFNALADTLDRQNGGANAD